MTERPFLEAVWKHLAIITYDVPPSLLEPRVPPGCVLDLKDGRAFVSLVAFDFLSTRVRGMPWPDFPEINLRFYVRQGADRGVVFVREFVPSRWVSWVARTIYNEPYRAARIVSEVDTANHRLLAERRLSWGGKEHSIRVVASREPYLAKSDSTEHFFKEHQWGFGIDRNGGLVRYEVRHPVWQSVSVVETSVVLDWALVYGNEFSGLTVREPICSSLALGSEIAVFPKASG